MASRNGPCCPARRCAGPVLGGDIPPSLGDGSHCSWGAPHQRCAALQWRCGEGVFCSSQALARKKKILPNPKGNRTSTAEEGDGRAGEEEEEQERKEILLQFLVALGRWVLAFIDGAASFHQEWLEITIPPLIHQSLCERPDSLLLVGKRKKFFFFFFGCVLGFAPLTARRRVLPRSTPCCPITMGQKPGGSLKAPALPLLSFKI